LRRPVGSAQEGCNPPRTKWLASHFFVRREPSAASFIFNPHRTGLSDRIFTSIQRKDRECERTEFSSALRYPSVAALPMKRRLSRRSTREPWNSRWPAHPTFSGSAVHRFPTPIGSSPACGKIRRSSAGRAVKYSLRVQAQILARSSRAHLFRPCRDDGTCNRLILSRHRPIRLRPVRPFATARCGRRYGSSLPPAPPRRMPSKTHRSTPAAAPSVRTGRRRRLRGR
jgi:hypothetical protein